MNQLLSPFYVQPLSINCSCKINKQAVKKGFGKDGVTGWQAARPPSVWFVWSPQCNEFQRVIQLFKKSFLNCWKTESYYKVLIRSKTERKLLSYLSFNETRLNWLITIDICDTYILEIYI